MIRELNQVVLAEGYEVEFAALNGDTVAVTSVYAEQVRPARPSEMPHARAMG